MIVYILISIVSLVVGVYLAAFGGSLLFKKGYVEKMEREVWKTQNEKGTRDYNYDKYTRGIRYLGIGLMFVFLSVFFFLNR